MARQQAQQRSAVPAAVLTRTVGCRSDGVRRMANTSSASRCRVSLAAATTRLLVDTRSSLRLRGRRARQKRRQVDATARRARRPRRSGQAARAHCLTLTRLHCSRAMLHSGARGRSGQPQPAQHCTAAHLSVTVSSSAVSTSTESRLR